MDTTFELRAGKRPLVLRDAATPQEALLDYARSLGCSDEELLRVAPDAISWRGAVYRALPARTRAAAGVDPEPTREIPPEELPEPPGQPPEPTLPDERPWRDPEPPPWDAPGTPPAPEPRLPDEPPGPPDRDI